MFAHNWLAVVSEYADAETGGADEELEDLRKILARHGAESNRGLRS